MTETVDTGTPNPGEIGSPELLPMGIRAWTTRPAKAPPADTEAPAPPKKKPPKLKRELPHEALIFDTETRDEPGQGLLFGIWRLYSDNLDTAPATYLVEEGFFYPDDLPQTDPVWFARMVDYVSNHQADDVPAGNDRRLLLWPESRWLEERLHRYGFKHRDRCNVVGFNLPFDLGGLAKQFGSAQPRKGESGVDYYGGWSLSFFGHSRPDGSWHTPRYHPRLKLKSIDPRRTLIGWAPLGDDEPGERAKGQGGGRFVDLRTLAFALTDKSLRLESACDLFGHPYEKVDVEYGVITEQILTYGRDDVAATAQLYRDCLAELAKHPGIDLPPHRLYSPATVGARYLDAMGVPPPLTQHQIPDEFLGDAMSAFYGGRAEARIVRVPVPVVVADFTSMYPAQNALLRTWDILTAETLELDDVTAHAKALLADPNLFERLHRKETWGEDIGVTFVQIDAIDGAVLPVRARYEQPLRAATQAGPDSAAGSLGIGINPLHYDGTLTYALPDLIASMLLTPAAGSPRFRVLKATRLRPVGKQTGLTALKLRGTVDLDPAARDPFLAMIEERHRVSHDQTIDPDEKERLDLFLKITANATSYGSLARFDRQEKPNPVAVIAYGPAGVVLNPKTSSPEEPGAYCFPPIAASITAGARLMLALVETEITRAGGSYAFMDTDSVAIVATPSGGPTECPGEPDGTLTALSHAQVRTILGSFDDLNPYGPVVTNPDPDLLRSPWKVEYNSLNHPLNALVISAKRYLLFRGNSNDPELVHAGVLDDDTTETESDNQTHDGGAEHRSDTQSVEPWDLENWSEHGIGLYQDPLGKRDDTKKKRRIWIRETWDYLLQQSLGLDPKPPTWVDRPALTQFTMSSPRQLRWFGHRDSGTPDPATPRPGGFGLLAQTSPSTVHDSRVPMPVACYTSKPAEWDGLNWYERSTGRPLPLITADPDEAPETYAEQLSTGRIALRTLGSILNRYQERPEHKSLAPDGTPAGPATRGKLLRRPVHAHPATTELIGKESNKLAERLAGTNATPGAAVTEYGTLGDPWTELVLPVLREIGAPDVAKAVGISERSIRRWLAGARPHDGPTGHMQRAIDIARAHGPNGQNFNR